MELQFILLFRCHDHQNRAKAVHDLKSITQAISFRSNQEACNWESTTAVTTKA